MQVVENLASEDCIENKVVQAQGEGKFRNHFYSPYIQAKLKYNIT